MALPRKKCPRRGIVALLQGFPVQTTGVCDKRKVGVITLDGDRTGFIPRGKLKALSEKQGERVAAGMYMLDPVRVERQAPVDIVHFRKPERVEMPRGMPQFFDGLGNTHRDKRVLVQGQSPSGRVVMVWLFPDGHVEPAADQPVSRDVPLVLIQGGRAVKAFSGVSATAHFGPLPAALGDAKEDRAYQRRLKAAMEQQQEAWEAWRDEQLMKHPPLFYDVPRSVVPLSPRVMRQRGKHFEGLGSAQSRSGFRRRSRR